MSQKLLILCVSVQLNEMNQSVGKTSVMLEII